MPRYADALEDVLVADRREGLGELLVVGRPEESEGRDQRARADAGDDVELRPRAGLCPAGKDAGTERAAAAAARKRQRIDLVHLDGRIGLCRRYPLLAQLREAAPSGKRQRNRPRRGYRGGSRSPGPVGAIACRRPVARRVLGGSRSGRHRPTQPQPLLAGRPRPAANLRIRPSNTFLLVPCRQTYRTEIRISIAPASRSAIRPCEGNTTEEPSGRMPIRPPLQPWQENGCIHCAARATFLRRAIA